MDKRTVRLIAFDLDGTLTQHKTPLSPEHRKVLSELSERYRLLMCGAGMCRRVFDQMGRFPVDIIGSYGMQFARYDAKLSDIVTVRDVTVPVDRPSIEERTTALRKKYGFTVFAGDNVQYHPSGCVTIPLLGTAAAAADKLAFDPDRKKRRLIYGEVKAMFPEYNVFIGGSSSFDMAPRPYDKAYALREYIREAGIAEDEVVYAGDDYGPGGNDEAVYLAGFEFVKIDDYRDFPKAMAPFLR